MERIVRAAVIHRDRPRSLPPPNRHHNVIARLAKEFPGDLPISGEQGFITSDGRFVDRKEGLIIAQRAGQIKEKVGCAGLLFSEDVW